MIVRLDPKALPFFIVSRTLGLTFIFALLTVLLVTKCHSVADTAGHKVPSGVPLIFMGVTFIIVAIPYTILQVLYSWAFVRSFAIELRSTGLCITSGVLSQTTYVMPYNQIQDVVIQEPAIERIFGVVTLVAHNASGRPRFIYGLGAAVAEELRNQILKQVNT